MDNNLRPTRRPELPNRNNYRGNSLRSRMHGANNSNNPLTEKQTENADINQPSEPKPTTDYSHSKQKKQITLSMPSLPRIKFKKIVITTASILLGLLILGGIAFGITKLTANEQPFPDSIKKQLSFVVFYPDDKKVTLVDKDTVKFDKTASLLSFVGETENGAKLTFSQTPTPESFNDIQQAYPALLEKLGSYSSFESLNGKVTLAVPTDKELQGTQLGILNSKGTLVIVRPSKNLSNDDWKKIFNNLIIVK